MADTNSQFDAVVSKCRLVFLKKLHDYGAAWRILRPQSVTDQIFIKANRIRSLEVYGDAKVDEGIRPEFIAIVNYGVVGLIQLDFGYTEQVDLSTEEALKFYDEKIAIAKSLMMDKNHDYDEAWRSMRIPSYTDLILMKLYRTKQIEDLCGQTFISEGIDANYLDMMNYAIFGLIRMDFDGVENSDIR
jgi:hypothetical protein